jgi:DNA-binding transcriptional LysR family regulator
VQTQSGPGLIAAALAGLGVALSTDLAAAEALRNSTLVRLLADYEMPPKRGESDKRRALTLQDDDCVMHDVLVAT